MFIMPLNTPNKNEKKDSIVNDKNYRRYLGNINNMIGQANLSMYGTDRTSDVDTLNTQFQQILNNEIDSMKNHNDGDITSFLSQIVSQDNKINAQTELFDNQFMALSGDEYSTMQTFMYDAYRNRFLEQSDLHEVSSQLIELSEAILITRDAIISADVVEGRMSRTLKFEDINDDDEKNYIPIVENMEKKFKTQKKIKDFIVPKTLDYGEYFSYDIPYSKLFNDFMQLKSMTGYHGGSAFGECVMESFSEKNDARDENYETFDMFVESTYKEYTKGMSQEEKGAFTKSEFKEDMKNLLGNIEVCNESVPICMLEEGSNTIEYFKEMTESVKTEANAKNMFDQVNSGKISSDGIILDNGTKEKTKVNEFDDIGDCYNKLIEPTRILPIEIMDTVIGYYYIQDEDITPLSGAVSTTLYYSKFDEHRRERTIVDSIAEQVVKSFNKPFLKKNIKFKKTIVDCINYWNLNEKRLKFQFISPEYITVFKIDEDEEGHGQSMIKKSLFYAKLYLMLLLFKIMSIILYSNDTKVNYIKQSGIDKNVANKVQEIARIRQSRQINITDLFSYTTLINKVGSGSEMYIPTGRSGERPIETEILSGQDIPLNTELLEMLKNAYILATGVPAAIINYLNEADFAKVIEQNNTKFNGRVVNYQLDFNESITEWYKKLMKWSTNIPENIIDNFSFSLQPPKTTTINTKNEIISQFQTVADFFVSLLYDDPTQSMEAENLQKEIKEFKKLLAEDQLPMLDMDNVDELVKKAKLNVLDQKLKPNPVNGDNGNDDGLNEEIDNIQL